MFSRDFPSRFVLGIDASRSEHSHPTGVERYSEAIVKALLSEGIDQTFDVRLYTPRPLKNFPLKLQRVLRAPRLWTLVRLSLEMLLHRPDLLFVPSHVLPFFAPRASFVMIHDVAFCRHPEAYSFFQRLYLRWSTQRALRLCQKVFTPSRAVAHDLEHFFGMPSAHAIVIPHGPGAASSDVPTLPLGEGAPLSQQAPLFFYVGRLDRKKNLLTLLRAWEQVQSLVPQARLILAGRAGDASSDIEAFLRNKSLRVELMDYVSDAELQRLYQSAHALVYPSLEEGFGLPLLEAFAAPCAVICSAIPALQEVGGSASLLCEPQDPHSFADAMLRLIHNTEEVHRLRALGQERLKAFSWKKAAQTVQAVLESAQSSFQ